MRKRGTWAKELWGVRERQVGTSLVGVIVSIKKENMRWKKGFRESGRKGAGCGECVSVNIKAGLMLFGIVSLVRDRK